MTLIAIHAVVDIAGDALVIRVGLRLGVAVGTREHGEITRVGMASRAHTVCPAVIRWEPRVVEGRVQPAGCAVTRLASGRESCGGMIRIIRGPVVRLVTRVAVRRNRCVIVIYVAHRTGYGRVGVIPSQGEWRVVVVEGSRNPRRRAVAYIALLWESGGNVVRIIRPLIILQVA